MKTRLICLLLFGIAAMSCKKAATVEKPIDEQGGKVDPIPLKGVYLLGYTQQGMSTIFDNVLYKDIQSLGALRPYQIPGVYPILIHDTGIGTSSESFNYLGIEYVNNRTRIVYLKKEAKETLSIKAGINVPANFNEYILANNIYNGDLYISVRQVDIDNKIANNYCYKITKAGAISALPLTNNEFYGLEFISILPSGVITATLGSPYGDGKFRIYKGSSELAAIDFATEDFKYTYVNSFHMKNDNEVEFVFMGYRSPTQPSYIFYATYNLNTKTLKKYKTDLSYDERGYAFQDWAWDNGKFYLATYEVGKNKCWALTIEFDGGSQKVKLTKMVLEMGPGAKNSTTNNIFVKNGNIFVTGQQGDKYSYWENGKWIDPSFQNQRQDFIADVLYLP